MEKKVPEMANDRNMRQTFPPSRPTCFLIGPTLPLISPTGPFTAILVYSSQTFIRNEYSGQQYRTQDMKTYICMNNQLVGMLSCLAAAVAGTEGGNTENNTPTLIFRTFGADL
jgi:hypothetical protein